MPTIFRILPYHQASASARSLSNAIEGAVRLLRNPAHSSFQGGTNYTVINWGNSRIDHPAIFRGHLLNHPAIVSHCTNKLRTFQHMSATTTNLAKYCLPYTRENSQALSWLSDGHTVMCRTLLSSSQGRGIRVARNSAEFIQAPLYTRFIHPASEFRIHVMNNKIIDTTRKGQRRNSPDANQYIRNYSNGYVFMRGDLPDYTREVEACQAAALEITSSFSLDFAAFDMLYSSEHDSPLLLEINTAPGLEGTSLAAYATNFPLHYGRE